MDSLKRLILFGRNRIPVRSKLILTLRPFAYGENVFMDDISGNLGEDVVVEWRELYGEDVPIVAYMIPESMQDEMFAVLGKGLWFDSDGTAKQVNCIELAQSPEINQWAVWYRLDAAAGLGNREVLFYHPDLITVADVAKISSWFKDPAPSALSDAILYYDAEADTDRELTGGPSTFNSSIIGTQYRRSADGTYTAVSAGGPIVDTFEDGFVGLRSCGAVTNLLNTGMDNFTQTWGAARVTASIGGFLETADTGTHIVFFSRTGLSPSTAYAFSVDVKANGRNFVHLNLVDPGVADYRTWFDLTSDGAVATKPASVSASIQSLSDGWFRLHVSRTNSASQVSINLQIGSATDDGVFSFAGDAAKGVILRNPILTATAYPQPYVPPGVTQSASNATTSGGNWFTNPDGSPLWQALTGQPITLATRVRMGVGSGDLPNSTSVEIMSSAAQTYGIHYAEKTGAGATHIVRSYDRTTVSPAISFTEWNRNAIIQRFTQVNTAGTQFRVGYMIEGVHTEIKWSAWVTYDGSFNPSTLYRLMYGYNNAYPMWLNKLAVWKRQVSDTELLEVLS